MLRIFQIIKSLRYFILFLLLEIISLKIFFNFKSSSKMAFLESLIDVRNSVSLYTNELGEYFTLKRTNEKLMKENIWLRNQLQNTFYLLPKANYPYFDTIWDIHQQPHIKQYIIYEAKVVGIENIHENKYFHVFRGANQGIKKNMAVFSNEGIVGVAIQVSPNFTTLLSILNKDSKVSAKIKNTNFNGYVEWEGKNNEMVMENLPINYKINLGDSVVTSQYSNTYIPNSYIGKVNRIELGTSKNSYKIYITLGVNFDDLDLVYLVENKFLDEFEQLVTTVNNNIKLK